MEYGELKRRLFELALASEFRLFRLQTTVFQQVYSHAAKLLFFATLNKLLSLEKESKLSLYSLTAVFFCGCKRKRYKKRKNHAVAVQAGTSHLIIRQNFCIFASEIRQNFFYIK